MVGPGRLELPTSRLSGVCSNHLSYRPLKRHVQAKAQTRDRTATSSAAVCTERETKTAAFRLYVYVYDEPIEREALEAHP